MTLHFRPEVDVLADARGALAAGSPLPQYGPLVPRFLELRDGLLRWSWWDQQPPPADDAEAWARNFTNPPEPADATGMLDAFVRIGDSTDVLRFATRYGVFEICEHGLPGSHNPPPVPLRDEWRGCRAWGEQEYLYWEPVEIWLQFVAQMRALLSLAVELRAGSPGRKDDWRVAHSQLLWLEGLDDRGCGADVNYDRIALAERISKWMHFGNVRPELFWQGELPAFRLSGNTFGILGVQLLFAATRSQGVSICTGCGMPYTPKRKPRKDRRNFCLNCGEPVAARLRKRASRARSGEKGA